MKITFIGSLLITLAFACVSVQMASAQFSIPSSLGGLFHKPTPTPVPKTHKKDDKKDDKKGDKDSGSSSVVNPLSSLLHIPSVGGGSNKPDIGKMITGAIDFSKGAAGVSRADELNLGDSVAILIVSENGGIDQDPAAMRRVVLIGKTLCHTASYPTGFEFGLLASSSVNAFSAPGGWIFITRGLYDQCNDAELAAILGHEMRHVIHRDALQLISGAEMLKGFEETASGAFNVQGFDSNITNISRTIMKVGFSRGQELAADSSGREYASDSGFKRDALVDLLTDLRGKYGNHDPRTDLSKPFPTHPSFSERIDNLQGK